MLLLSAVCEKSRTVECLACVAARMLNIKGKGKNNEVADCYVSDTLLCEIRIIIIKGQEMQNESQDFTY
jgi:hypothetical protein